MEGKDKQIKELTIRLGDQRKNFGSGNNNLAGLFTHEGDSASSFDLMKSFSNMVTPGETPGQDEMSQSLIEEKEEIIFGLKAQI